MQTTISNLKLCKPVSVGFSVLDLSKLLMYSFRYDTMLRYYKNIHPCFTNTDSLLYEVETNNIYVDMLKEYHKYDFRVFPINHPN